MFLKNPTSISLFLQITNKAIYVPGVLRKLIKHLATNIISFRKYLYFTGNFDKAIIYTAQNFNVFS